jgi:SAM-dependent methyltransferase
VKSEQELADAAVALGAAGFGGPLSATERRLVATATPYDSAGLAAAIRAGADPLGDAFIALRSPLARRAVGAFYTPPQIVAPMVAWAMSQDPARVVDAGCGSGRFAMAATRAKPSVEIVAIDLDPLATLIARANLAVLGASAQVLCANYLTARIPPGGKTAWIGNPPYVRHHDLTPAAKAWARQAASRLGHSVSGLAGLHALFFLATALRAKPGDVGCFVSSAEWLDVGYGSVVRSLLLNGLGGASLDLIDPRAVPFADAMTTALITSFVAGQRPITLALHLVADPADLRLGGGAVVEVKTLAATNRWSPLFRAGSLAVGERLGTLARVHRGVATGANDFFTMTKAEAEKRGLAAWARPVVSSAAEVLASGGVIHDGPERRVIVDLPPDLDLVAHSAARAFLRAGKETGIDRRYLCSHRRPWWRLGLATPPIVATYMARQAPRFALNPDGLALLNIAHGIWPQDGVDPAVLVSRLNAARLTFTGAGRTYHGGLEKFEPREMEALVLP